MYNFIFCNIHNDIYICTLQLHCKEMEIDMGVVKYSHNWRQDQLLLKKSFKGWNYGWSSKYHWTKKVGTRNSTTSTIWNLGIYCKLFKILLKSRLNAFVKNSYRGKGITSEVLLLTLHLQWEREFPKPRGGILNSRGTILKFKF